MLLHIKSITGKEPPCPQAFIKKAVHQNKYKISLKEAQTTHWFNFEKRFCTNWYEQDGILYMEFDPEEIYVVEINSLEDLCKLKEELGHDIILGYSDYKDVPYRLTIDVFS